MRFSLTKKLKFYLLLRFFLGSSTTIRPVLTKTQPLLNVANVELYIIFVFLASDILVVSRILLCADILSSAGPGKVHCASCQTKTQRCPVTPNLSERVGGEDRNLGSEIKRRRIEFIQLNV